jgi:hypothetical protein
MLNLFKTASKEQKLNPILIPASFKLVDLPKEDDARKELLSQYDGKLVLINDGHDCLDNEYFFARLKIDKNDEICYYIQRIAKDKISKEIAMQYHDLKSLLV